MKRRATSKDWLPLARTGKGAGELPTGEAFKPEWIDFEHGLRVGNLEPHERITRILKYRLETAYGTDFVTDRWGRGVYWQWICWLPRADREAKPVSHDVNFGCAKLFISIDRERGIFQSGLQVERGYVTGQPQAAGFRLRPDWDWHRLLAGCSAGTELDGELRRLVKRDGFTVEVEGADSETVITAANWRSALQVRNAAARCDPGQWASFQLYYPTPESEVKASSGYEMVQAVMGAFAEVIGVMNMCMQIRLEPRAAPRA